MKKREWLQKLYDEGHTSKPPPPQEPPPHLYPDLYWIWEAYCFLNERRGVGPNGPIPITVQDMLAYAELTGRVEQPYRHQLLRFIPPLDRTFLRDFYERQQAEMEKLQKKHSANRSRR